MAWDKRVPFAEDGSLVTYVFARLEEGIKAGTSYPRVTVTWKDLFEFEGRLKLEGMTRGRSAARFIWSDEKDCKYEMFMADMVKLIQSGAVIEDGCCFTKWTFTKRGANFGVTVAL